MKAVVYTEYGSPDVLEYKDVPRPTPKKNEVLVRVHAASINSWDWDLLRGTPLIVRMWGLFKPKYTILGADIAGRVEAVGKGVTRFQPGDEVYGDLCGCGWGGFAEYACARESALVRKPASMTFEEAAAIPQAGVMASQGLHDKRPIGPGDKVMMNGAGGGVGTFAVQIAKSLGAEVTAVDGPHKLERLRALGADHVVDYTREDFTKSGRCYDLILDVAAYRSVFEYKRALTSDGVYAAIGGSMPRVFQTMFLGPMVSLFGGRKLGILAHQPNKDLAVLNELFEAGKVAPVIDTSYPLNDVAEAFRYYGTGDFFGKIVINLV